MSTRRPTILDVAAALQLSKTTVSDALQGRGRVSPATIAEVRAKADELGYVGNRAAKQLRGSRIGAYGIYIPPVVRSFAFYVDFVSGAITAADRCGADLVLITRDAETLRRRPPAVDGILAIDPLPGDPVLEVLAQRGVPLVTAGRPPLSIEENVNGVIEVDYIALVKQILDKKHENGKRSPVLLISDHEFRSSFTEDVVKSYRDWCENLDVLPAVRTISVHAEPRELAKLVSDIFTDSKHDLIVCGYQGLAGRVLPLAEAACGESGCPEVVSLVGDPLTELPDERITCLDVRPKEFGAATIELLNRIFTTPGPPVVSEHPAAVKWARSR